MNTNSLKPLNDDTTSKELARSLKIGKNKVSDVLKTLFDYGVYGRFEVSETEKEYTRYWILNPYLAFNGKIIPRAISDFFKNTKIAKAYFSMD